MNIRRLNFRRILIQAAILAQLIYFILSWAGMIVDHYQRTGSYFMGFYSFGWIAERKGYDQIYNLDEQQKLQEQIVGHPVTPIFHTHIPLTAPLSALVGDEDYVASFKRWSIVLLGINALNIYLLVQLLDRQKLTRENLLVLAAGAYLFDPTFSGLMNGQDTAIVLLGASLFVTYFFSERYALAGLGLSLTTFRPQIAIFLALPFLFRHRRVFWGFVFGSLVLVVIGIGLLGLDGTLRFLEALRYIEATVWHETHALDMPTIAGMIRRNFVLSDPEPVKTLMWAIYGTGIACFSLLWHRNPVINERHIGLLFTAGIFLLPYAHYHDLILLLIPLFCTLRLFQGRSLVPPDELVVIPLILSWLLMLGFAGSGAFKFPIVYMVMLLLVYSLFAAEKRSWPFNVQPPPAPGS